jgi:purine-nucleoside phosphorylase
MSTVPENIVAVHSGMRVLGLSVVTDECFPDTLQPVNIQEIIETANNTEPKLTLIMKEVIKRI